MKQKRNITCEDIERRRTLFYTYFLIRNFPKLWTFRVLYGKINPRGVKNMKLKVGVIFGGKSVEHEISIITALQAMDYIDTDYYEVVPIYITKDLTWYSGGMFRYIDSFNNYNLIEKYGTKVHLVNKNGRYILERAGFIKSELTEIHIAFPMVHGMGVEDGSIQGYLSQIGVPCVGNNIYSSAICQDKVFTKQILKSTNIPITNYIWFYESDYQNNKENLFKKIDKLNYPLIIKPACLGSSVGIEIIKNKEELDSTIKRVLSYDHKIVIEEMIKGTEFNISILRSNEKYLTSAIEEIKCEVEFRAYKDKCYKDGEENDTIKRYCPAKIKEELEDEIKEIAHKTFNQIFSTGFCRIDFLYDGKKLYVNEINPIPNCFCHHLWIENNISYKELLNILIKDAIKTKNIHDNMTTTIDSTILKDLKTKDIKEMI